MAAAFQSLGNGFLSAWQRNAAAVCGNVLFNRKMVIEEADGFLPVFRNRIISFIIFKSKLLL
ncbi:hypothetical protein B5F34_02055 [Mediterranea sp. An20]|nr:hypothetical protein B5F34_02055 [Mediterranea sp. An20]